MCAANGTKTTEARRKTRWAELLLSMGSAAFYDIGSEYTRWDIFFIAALIVFWAGYAAYRRWREPGVLGEWGLRRRNLLPASLACAVATLVGSGVILVYGRQAGSVHFRWGYLIMLGIYLPWALLQQLVWNAMTVRNLRMFLPAWLTVLVSAALLAVAHFPRFDLAALAAAAAIVWAPIYLRWRNLWPLAGCHAVLGTLALYVILRRHPWAGIEAVMGR